MAEQSRKSDSIFWAAMEMDVHDERVAYLDEACGGDQQLRAQVEELLAAYPKVQRFLEQPAANIGATLDQPSVTEKPGDQIGHYKLLQEIGEGGFGVVYMAEQTEPVRRQVALKIIKPGMDTREVIARFESERQALALMDHPNVAKVLDAGATDSGRPYFVMELVHGVPITEFCDKNNLAPRHRLEMFVDICHAIQHAHQKGVIHRDIKPSNIMVTLHDGKPVPKVIDFGVAKATSQKLTERTLFTAYGQMIGTPTYMSPEQAEMSGLGIDTRSDIYSLGVLLYELLTGATPLDATRLRKSGYAEMQRLIREQEPPLPSVKLSTMGDKAAIVAKHRRTDAIKLGQLLRGELDWIVMKALEKERDRRYETANGFARDVQRYLADETVEACPPSTAYRLKKTLRRHKGLVRACAAVLTVLLIGIVGTTWGLVRAEKQRARAEAERDEKEAAFAAETDARREAEAARASATRERDSAIAAREEADQQRQIAQHQRDATQQNLYYAQMYLAGQASEQSSGGIARVQQLLENWHPEASGRDLRGWEWYYLDSLCHRDLFTLRGHTGGVLAVSWSPDGTQLASGSNDNMVNVWDAASGDVIHTLCGHSDWLRAVCWSPDGRRLASASKDHTIKIWDPNTGKVIHTLRGHSAIVNAVGWCPNGRQLASASGDNTIKVWDPITGEEIQTLRGHSDWVLSVAWSPDGRRLASQSGDQIKVWDTAAGQETLSLPGHHWRHGGCLSWRPDGNQLVSAGGEWIKVWDLDADQQPHTLRGHTASVLSITWSSDGTRLASASGDRTLKIWDAATWTEIRVLEGHTAPVRSVCWNPDGTRLASASHDGSLKVWDADPPEQPRTLSGHAAVEAVAWSPDGEQLASARLGDTVHVWDVITGHERVIQLHSKAVPPFAMRPSLAWSPDGKRLVASSSDKTVRVCDSMTGELLHALPGHTNVITSVAWSPNGKQLVSGSNDRTVKVWDADTGEVIHTLGGHPNPVRSVCWSPDGARLGSADSAGMVRVWDVISGQVMRSLLRSPPGANSVRSIAWSPNGTRLAWGGTNETINVWDVDTDQEPLILYGHIDDVMSVSWSPDGTRLASASGDQTIRVWDAITGEQTLTLRGHSGAVLAVCFSPDGTALVSASEDGIKIWDATIGFQLGGRQPKRTPPVFSVNRHWQVGYGEARFLISGLPASFVIKDVRGDVVIRPTMGTIPSWVEVSSLDSTKAQRFSFAVQRSDTNQIVRPVGVLVGATNWNVKFYSWDKDKPLTSTDNWLQLVQSEPLAEQTVPRIDFAWGEAAPTDGVPADNFATIATTELQLPAGNYEFWTRSDSGVRLFVDGKKIIDNWTPHFVTLDVAEVSLDDKKHTVRIEHFDSIGNAQMEFDIRAAESAVFSDRKP